MTEMETKQYTFEEMVDMAYQELTVKSKPKSTLIIPNLKTDIGTTRLHWKNVDEILHIICRSHDHFIAWLKDELPDKQINWYSASYEDGLIIHGKYRNDKELGALLMKYINNFVVCMCKSANTTMTKDMFICNDCGVTKFI